MTPNGDQKYGRPEGRLYFNLQRRRLVLRPLQHLPSSCRLEPRSYRSGGRLRPWQAFRGPARTPQPLRLCLTYRFSLHWALVVAMPWVTPRAVAVTPEQCRAWAGCGARLKAAIALTDVSGSVEQSKEANAAAGKDAASTKTEVVSTAKAEAAVSAGEDVTGSVKQTKKTDPKQSAQAESKLHDDPTYARPRRRGYGWRWDWYPPPPAAFGMRVYPGW
jgi:hypothetical protein